MGRRRRKSASHRLDQIGRRSAASCSLRLSKASSPSSRALTPARAWRASLGDEGLPELALGECQLFAERPLRAPAAAVHSFASTVRSAEARFGQVESLSPRRITLLPGLASKITRSRPFILVTAATRLSPSPLPEVLRLLSAR